MASASSNLKSLLRNPRSKSEEIPLRALNRKKESSNNANQEYELPNIDVVLNDQRLTFEEGNWELQANLDEAEMKENERLKTENATLQMKFDSILRKLSEKSAYLNFLDKTIDELTESLKKLEAEELLDEPTSSSDRKDE